MRGDINKTKPGGSLLKVFLIFEAEKLNNRIVKRVQGILKFIKR